MTDKKTQQQINEMKRKISIHQEKISQMIRDLSISNETSSVYWAKKTSDIKKEYNNIKWIFKDFSTDILEKDFKLNLKNEFDKIQKLKSMKAYKPLIIFKELRYKEFLNTDRISNMKNNAKLIALTDFNMGIDNGIKKLSGLIRGTQQKLIHEREVNKMIEEGFQEKRTWQASMKLLKLSLLEQGKIVTILCKDGITRHYDPGKYAELVVRTRMRESETNATKQTALGFDTDLVQVSAHNTDCKVCSEYEGKIYSIGGVSPDFPELDEEPPYHPNCMHLLIVQFREILEHRGIDQYTAFSNGEIDKPPYIPSYVALDERKLS